MSTPSSHSEPASSRAWRRDSAIDRGRLARSMRSCGGPGSASASPRPGVAGEIRVRASSVPYSPRLSDGAGVAVRAPLRQVSIGRAPERVVPPRVSAERRSPSGGPAARPYRPGVVGSPAASGYGSQTVMTFACLSASSPSVSGRGVARSPQPATKRRGLWPRMRLWWQRRRGF